MVMLKCKINRCRQNNVRCLCIVHGYGSKNVGGAIRVSVRKWLIAQLKNGKIKAVVFGEEFNVFNETVRKLIINYAGFEDLLHSCNHGVTVIVL